MELEFWIWEVFGIWQTQSFLHEKNDFITLHGPFILLKYSRILLTGEGVGRLTGLTA